MNTPRIAFTFGDKNDVVFALDIKTGNVWVNGIEMTMGTIGVMMNQFYQTLQEAQKQQNPEAQSPDPQEH